MSVSAPRPVLAAAGWCHRVWAAEALADAGWRVVLDGELLETPCAP